MLSQDYKIINASNTIKNAMPYIIDAFVQFYGEEKREEIAKKFNNTLILTYQTPEDLERVLNDIEKEESERITKEFFEEVKEEYNNENKDKYFYKYGLFFEELNPIHSYYLFLKHDKSSINDKTKEKAVTFLSQFYDEVNMQNIEDLVSKKQFLKMDKLVVAYERVLEKIKKVRDDLTQYRDIVKTEKNIKNKLKRKYFCELLKEFKHYIPEDDFNYTINNLISDNSQLSSYVESYFGFSLDEIPVIEAFSNDNEKVLNDENSSNWKKRSIKQDRIRFFKKLGIDHGDDYEAYVNDPLCTQKIPSTKLIDEILSVKEKYVGLYKKEYYSSTENYKINSEKIRTANLMIENNGFGPGIYSKGTTCVVPNLKNDQDGITVAPVLYYNSCCICDYMDQYLIHELNHVYELTLKELGTTKGEFCFGWDIIPFDVEKKDVEELSDDVRKYELLSEAINELISQNITSFLHEKGIYIFNTKENAKIRGATSYEIFNPLLREFIEKYKNEIIQTRSSGDLTPLFDKIGKENFEEYNKLFNDYNSNFSGFRIYDLYDDLNSGKETENTNIYNRIMKKKNDIIEKMMVYKKGVSI